MAGTSTREGRCADSGSVTRHRLWPVNLVIFLLAGSLIGFIVMVGDFQDPRVLVRQGAGALLMSDWGRLAGVLITLVVLLIAIESLSRGPLHQVQFCVLVSLLLHCWTGIAMYTQRLPLPSQWREEAARAMEEPAPTSLPDYHWEHVEQPGIVQDYETPVETESPQPAGPQFAQAEARKIGEPAPAKELTPVEPEQFHQHMPDRTPLERAEMPAPRRGERVAGGQISRQDLRQTLDPGAPVPMPKIGPSSPDRIAQAASPAANAQRQRMAPSGEAPGLAGTVPERRLSSGISGTSRKVAQTAPQVEPGPGHMPGRMLAAPTDLAEADVPEPVVPPERADAGSAGGRLNSRPTSLARGAVGPGLESGAADPDAAGFGAPGRAVTSARRAEPAPAFASTPRAPLRRAFPEDTAPEIDATASEDPGVPAAATSANPMGASGAYGPASLATGRPGGGRVRTGRVGGSGLGDAYGDASAEAGRANTMPGPVLPGAGNGSDLGGRPGGGVRGVAGRRIGASGPSVGGVAGGGGIAAVGAIARSPGRLDLPGGVAGEGEGGMSVAGGAKSIGGTGTGTGGSGRGAGDGTGEGSLEVSGAATAVGPNRQSGGLQVRIDAPEGPGGLGRDPSSAISVPSRLARPQGETVHETLDRFVFAKSGGSPALDAKVREEPRPAFRGRDPRRRGGGGTPGSGPETDPVVERGIEFLARHQFPAGNWALDRLPQPGQPGYEDAGLGEMNADTAATGLALLAFLGDGYTHMEDRHQDTVRRGIAWLLKNQQADGRLFTPRTDQNRFTQFYGHAMATIALCEAYGMTGDRDLREPTQRAVRFIVATQNPELGGWRYTPQTESDTSVSGWKLMALKSAQMSGLEVPAATLQGVSHWLDIAQADGGARYRYYHYAGDDEAQRLGRRPNLAMTAEGLLMRMYLGWQRDNPALVRGAGYLRANLPGDSTGEPVARDSYYWYYASQVMFEMQGDYWAAWNARLRPMLEREQVRSGPLAGSWHPLKPTPDRWGKEGGRHFITALNLLMLEVAYRHLPLYQDLGK